MRRKKFISGYPALDLAATHPNGSAHPAEKLGVPADLDRWLKKRGIEAVGFQATEDDLLHAKMLREAIYRMASACASGKPFTQEVMDLVNNFASDPAPSIQLTAVGKRGIDLKNVREGLVVIAMDAVNLFGGWVALDKRIKKCAGDGCGFFFVDMSQNSRRQWCDMDTCGSKAKMETYLRNKGLKPS